MRKTALITGASGGIGRALAEVAALHGNDVVLVARKVDALHDLKSKLEKKYGITAVVIQQDLSLQNAARDLVSELKQQNITIDCLVNNVGMGGFGYFHEQDWEQIRNVLALNVQVLTELTRLLLPSMVERNGGKVLNIASTAAFLPGPLQAVYYAAKAYVVSFSQAIAEEVKQSNVSVTAYCPGATGTGFAQRGNLESTKLFSGKLDTPDKVAADAYRAMEKGLLVAGREKGMLFMLRYILPFLPRWLVLKLSRNAMEPKR